MDVMKMNLEEAISIIEQGEGYQVTRKFWRKLYPNETRMLKLKKNKQDDPYLYMKESWIANESLAILTYQDLTANDWEIVI